MERFYCKKSEEEDVNVGKKTSVKILIIVKIESLWFHKYSRSPHRHMAELHLIYFFQVIIGHMNFSGQ